MAVCRGRKTRNGEIGACVMIKFATVGPKDGEKCALLRVLSILPGVAPEDDPVTKVSKVEMSIDDLKALRRACKAMIKELERV